RNEHVSAAVQYNLTPVLMADRDFDLIEINGCDKLNCHLKFDTGMGRLGFPAADAARIAQKMCISKRIQIKGVCSHLASSEDCTIPDGKSFAQIREFRAITRFFSGITNNFHILNSAALLARKFLPTVLSQNLNWGARTGLSLYGVRPDFETVNATNPLSADMIDLKPVMTWKTEIVHELKLSKGQAVSYGGRWVAPKDARIAVLPVGY